MFLVASLRRRAANTAFPLSTQCSLFFGLMWKYSSINVTKSDTQQVGTTNIETEFSNSLYLYGKTTQGHGIIVGASRNEKCYLIIFHPGSVLKGYQTARHGGPFSYSPFLGRGAQLWNIIIRAVTLSKNQVLINEFSSWAFDTVIFLESFPDRSPQSILEN